MNNDCFECVSDINQCDLSSIDFIISIDETGTPSLKNINDATPNSKAWFCITGILIDKGIINESANKIISLKEKYWPDGSYNSKRVVFHSRDIRKSVGPFNPKIIDYNSFRKDLDEFIADIPVEIVSSLINKKLHVQKYLYPHPTYSLALEFLLERICFKLNWHNSTGVIFLESRGKREDSELLQQISFLLKHGNQYQPPKFFSCIQGIYFNRKRTPNGAKSYWPLEIADMISYRIFHEKTLSPSVNSRRFNDIEYKLMNYPNYDNKGIKIFPKGAIAE